MRQGRTVSLWVALAVGFYMSGLWPTAAPAARSEGRTLEICPEGCPYATLEAALTEAEPLDTLLLHPGVYPTAATITTPGLTIRGLEREGVVLTAREPYEAVLRVVARGGTILENLTFQGNPDPPKLRESEFGLAALQVLSFEEEGSVTVVLLDAMFSDWHQAAIEVRGLGAHLWAEGIHDQGARPPIATSLSVGNGAVAQVFDSTLTSIHVSGQEFTVDGDPIGFERVRGYLELRGSRLYWIWVSHGTLLAVDNRVDGQLWKTLLGNEEPWTYIVLDYGATALFRDNVIELGEEVEPSERGNGIEVWYGATLEAWGNRIRGYKEGISIPWHGGRVYLHDNELLNNEVGVFVGLQPTSFTVLEMSRNRIEGSGRCGVQIVSEDMEQAPNILTLKGEGNLFVSNAQDLCPEEYPWPENFVASDGR